MPTLVAGLGVVPRPTEPAGAGGAGQRARPPQDLHRQVGQVGSLKVCGSVVDSCQFFFTMREYYFFQI